MYKCVLIASDGSSLADKGVEQGLALAKQFNASVVFVVVTPHWSALALGHESDEGAQHPLENFERVQSALAKKILERCKVKADQIGISNSSVHVPDMTAAEGIVAAAREQAADVIVMSSHGRSGLNRVLMGSVAAKVVQIAGIPVMIAR